MHPSAADPSQAFVELRDTVGESFPSTSYTLASLDAAGTVLGRQVFTPPYGFAATTEPFLVAAAGRPARDAPLTIPLAEARKVCFYRGTGTTDGIHCLSFDAPPEGRSAQLTSSEAVVYACPTPDAANRQEGGTCTAAAPAPPAEPTPVAAIPPAAAPADARPPALGVTARRVQSVRRLRLRVRVDEQATIAISGSGRAAGATFNLVRVRRQVAAGVRVTYALRLTRAGQAVVRRAIGRGSTPRLTAKVVARDAAGNVVTRRVRIELFG